MKWTERLVAGLALLSLAQVACAVLAPTRAAPKAGASPSATPHLASSDGPTPQPAGSAAAASPATTDLPANPTPPAPAATSTAAPTDLPSATPSPTAAPLKLEVVQSQVWTDNDGNVRVNVLFRNPYDFPVGLTYRAGAHLLDSAGKIMRPEDLLFLDGISGAGFLLPKETVAAYACFTCEQAPLAQPWASVAFDSVIADATGQWKYSTDVAAQVAPVSLSAGSPIFDLAGTVTNKSKTALQRIAVRVVVFDQAHKLVGAGTALATDVAAGATVHFTGYGLGQAPAGKVTVVVTALGVNY